MTTQKKQKQKDIILVFIFSLIFSLSTLVIQLELLPLVMTESLRTNDSGPNVLARYEYFARSVLLSLSNGNKTSFSYLSSFIQSQADFPVLWIFLYIWSYLLLLIAVLTPIGMMYSEIKEKKRHKTLIYIVGITSYLFQWVLASMGSVIESFEPIEFLAPNPYALVVTVLGIGFLSLAENIQALHRKKLTSRYRESQE